MFIVLVTLLIGLEKKNRQTNRDDLTVGFIRDTKYSEHDRNTRQERLGMRSN